MKYSLLLSFCCFLLLFSCNKKIKKEYLKTIAAVPASYENKTKMCRDQLNYIPDLDHVDHTPIKYVRVNFHIMCNAEGKGNFDEVSGRKFIDEVMTSGNEKLSRNTKMNLPPGNNTPRVPMRYRYVLTGKPGQADDDGIYFHHDEELYAMIGKGKKKNNYSKAVYEKYGIQKDTVLNIFVMTHHIDSLESDTYVKDSKGIGFPNFVKVTHWHESVKKTKGETAKLRRAKWFAIKLLHHEIGHSLGLRHSWRGNDGCEDTPQHPNCWNKTKKAPCDTMWSNNFMDYNTHSSAWSPCQIGTIHRNFSDKSRKSRRLLIPNWCSLDETKTITIKDSIDWLGAKDLEGHLVIENGASLTVRCRLSMPKGAKITVHPKGRLILDAATVENDCGDTWKGIEVWSKDKEKGRVEVYNGAKLMNMENEISMVEG